MHRNLSGSCVIQLTGPRSTCGRLRHSGPQKCTVPDAGCHRPTVNTCVYPLRVRHFGRPQITNPCCVHRVGVQPYQALPRTPQYCYISRNAQLNSILTRIQFINLNRIQVRYLGSNPSYQGTLTSSQPALLVALPVIPDIASISPRLLLLSVD